MTDWKRDHANAAEHALEHPVVRDVMTNDGQRAADAIDRLFDRLNAMTEDEVERFCTAYSLDWRRRAEAQLAAWWEAATPEDRQSFRESFAPASGSQLTALATNYGVTREIRQGGDPDATYDPVRGVWVESDDALRRRVQRTMARDEAGEAD